MSTTSRRRRGKYRRSQFMSSIEFAEDPRFYLQPLAVQAAWYRLNVFCAGMVNGGVILDCQAWDERRWLIEIKLTRADVDAVVSAGLGSWCGSDLELDGYDHAGDKLWSVESDGGHKGNAIKKAKKLQNARAKLHVVPASDPAAPAAPESDAESDTERESESDTDSESDSDTPPDAQSDTATVTQPDTGTYVDPVTGSVQGSVTDPEPDPATAYASASASADTPSGVSSARAREEPGDTPPPDSSDRDPDPPEPPAKPRWFPWLQGAMADAGFRTETIAVREMRAYIRDEVGARSLDETAAFLRWIRAAALRQGQPMEYARHAGPAAARDWRENHQHRFQRAAEGAAP